MSKKQKIIRRIIVMGVVAIMALYVKGYRLSSEAILKHYRNLYPSAKIIDTVSLENQTLYVHEMSRNKETVYAVVPIKKNMMLYHTSEDQGYPSTPRTMGVIRMDYFDKNYTHTLTYIDPKYQVYQQYLEYQYTGSGETLELIPVKPSDVKEVRIEPVKEGYYFDVNQYQRLVIKVDDVVVSVNDGWFETLGNYFPGQVDVLNLKTNVSYPILNDYSRHFIDQFNTTRFPLEDFKITSEMEALFEVKEIAEGSIVTQTVYKDGSSYVVKKQSDYFEYVSEDGTYTETIDSTEIEISEIHHFLVEQVLSLINGA